MSKYLGDVIPPLFLMIKTVISENDTDFGLGISATDEASLWAKKMEVVTANSEEAEVAINMLREFLI